MKYYKIEIQFNDWEGFKTYKVKNYEVYPRLLKLQFSNGMKYFNLGNIREFNVYGDEAKLIKEE